MPRVKIPEVKQLLFIVLASLSVVACSPDAPTGEQELTTYPDELTKAEYDALSSEQKYMVANKLMSSMFRGYSVDEFFDLSQGMDKLALSNKGRNLLSDTKSAIDQSITEEQREFYDTLIKGYRDIGGERDIEGMVHAYDNNDELVEDWPKHEPLSRIMAFPLSKQVFDNFIAYVLVNTILFSPAEEIDSASIRDVTKVFNKLVDDLRENRSIQQIIGRHQRSQENWRRFRSPEDNTREMIEIYLGLFDRDADVPRASIACKNFYLTDASENYELIITASPNTRPQYVLDTFVTTCFDFYDVVAGHPRVIPRVTKVLVEYFFFERTSEERAIIIERIVAANPTTFQEIFKSILFSREYLINNERPKSYEENFFGLVHQLKWQPYKQFLQDMTLEVDDTTDTTRLKGSLDNMGWPTMTRKLGRFTGVPLDALSFANYHRALRDTMLIDGTNGSNGTCGNIRNPDDDVRVNNQECAWREGLGLIEPLEPVPPHLRDNGSGILTSPPLEEELQKYQLDLAEYNRKKALYDHVHSMTVDQFYDYLFMSVVQRRAYPLEKAELTSMIRDNKSYIREDSDQQLYIFINKNDTRREHRTNYDDVAKIVFDYLSRLPETYYYHKVQ